MGFLLFPIYGLLMGLRLAALWAAGALLKLYNTQEYLRKYWSSVIQTWHQKCTSPKRQNDNYYLVAMATLLTPVSFYEKPNIPICNLWKWDKGSSSEHTWFPYCLNSPHQIIASHGWFMFKIKSGKLKQDQQHNCCHSNGMAGVISLFFLRCTVLVPSLKNTALIFLEIILIECCTVLVKPPMTSSLSSFAYY